MSTTTKPAPVQWGVETYPTQRDCEMAIQGDIVDYLCNSDAGSVEIGATAELEGETFNLSVRVDILTPEGERAVRLSEAAPELLEALRAVDRADTYMHERGEALAKVRAAIAKATAPAPLKLRGI